MQSLHARSGTVIFLDQTKEFVLVVVLVQLQP